MSKENKEPKREPAEKKKPPAYEPPKLLKFDRLEKLIQGGE